MIEKEKPVTKEAPKGRQRVTRTPEIKIPKEIDSWLEKIEKGEDLFLSKPVTDDQTGQVLVTAPSARKPKIVLPLDKQQLVQGLTQKVSEAVRWLAEWCLRLIKMSPGKVKLKEKESD